MKPPMHAAFAAILVGAIGAGLLGVSVPAHAELVIDADRVTRTPPSVPAPSVEKPLAPLAPSSQTPSTSSSSAPTPLPPAVDPGDGKKTTPALSKSTSNTPASSLGVASKAPAAGGLREVGRSSLAPVRAEGWANGVPVSLAVKQVLPNGWTVRWHDGVDTTRSVSWSGGRPWPEVLRDLAKDSGFDAEVRWDERAVSIAPPPPPPPPKLPVSASSEGVPKALVSQLEPIKPIPAAPPPPPPLPSWSLDAKRTLRENVEAWAKQAGWNRVVWEAADYPIVAPAVFRGEFAAPDGPLARLIEAFETSDQPLLMELSTMDKVIHVSNRNYRPVVVEPQTAQAFDPSSFKDNKPEDRRRDRPDH